jgi:hypothetical protein
LRLPSFRKIEKRKPTGKLARAKVRIARFVLGYFGLVSTAEVISAEIVALADASQMNSAKAIFSSDEQ